MLEEVSLQPWLISKPLWESGWALHSCGHPHIGTCSRKVAASSSNVGGTNHPDISWKCSRPG